MLLLVTGLIGSSFSAANTNTRAQISHLELFFSQIMSVDEFRNYKNVLCTRQK